MVDVPEAGLIPLIFLRDLLLEAQLTARSAPRPTAQAHHSRQGGSQLQHVGKVSLGLLSVPHCCMYLAVLEVGLDVVIILPIEDGGAVV